MSSGLPNGPPPRLVDEPGLVGEVVRRARESLSEPGAEVAAWDRLEQRWAQRSWTLNTAAIAFGIATCVLLAFLVTRWGDRRDEEIVAEPSATTVAPDPIRAGDLTPGTHLLADGSQVVVSDASSAEVQTPREGQTHILLQRGSVSVSATPKAAGESLEVIAGDYRFRVVGTEFRVHRGGEDTELDVEEGNVAVYEGHRLLALVEAGGAWQSTKTRPPPDEAPAPTSVPSTANTTTEDKPCLTFARQGKHREALACFDQQAKGTGLRAEVALYEGARLRRNVMGDTSGALQDLRTYMKRFPNGTFRTEAAINVVEILAAQGDVGGALAASNQLLVSGAARERTDDLRMMRGRLHQRQGNWAAAEAEYAKVSQGPLAARAREQRAQCLEALGLSDEAEAIRRGGD